MLKALWRREKATFKGRHYQLVDAPLAPKPVQRPHPELMIGGGGEKVTLRIVARHADHWNVWGGPATLARKGRILDDYCRAAGRDPKTLARSANMPLLLTDDAAEVEKLKAAVGRRMGMAPEVVEDAVLAGSKRQVEDKLGRLRAAGVDPLFVPSMFLPKDPRPLLDRFIGEIAPAFR